MVEYIFYVQKITGSTGGDAYMTISADVYEKGEVDGKLALEASLASQTFTDGLTINSANDEAKIAFGTSGSSTMHTDLNVTWHHLGSRGDL